MQRKKKNKDRSFTYNSMESCVLQINAMHFGTVVMVTVKKHRSDLAETRFCVYLRHFIHR